MVFNQPKKKTLMGRGNQNLGIDIDGSPVQRVESYCYLGIQLDKRLNFNKHANNTINRVADKVYQLRKLRYLLTNKADLLIYKNMILPILETGISISLPPLKKTEKKLQIIQNKALKCALQKENRYSMTDLHNDARLSMLKLRRKYHLLLHIYQISHNKNFKGWKKSVIRTRSSKKKQLILKKPNLARFQTNLTYKGPKLWNSLPATLQKSENFYEFKTLLLKHLIALKKKLHSKEETSNNNPNLKIYPLNTTQTETIKAACALLSRTHLPNF